MLDTKGKNEGIEEKNWMERGRRRGGRRGREEEKGERRPSPRVSSARRGQAAATTTKPQPVPSCEGGGKMGWREGGRREEGGERREEEEYLHPECRLPSRRGQAAAATTTKPQFPRVKRGWLFTRVHPFGFQGADFVPENLVSSPPPLRGFKVPSSTGSKVYS